MAIYTRFGCPVEILAALIIPVWVQEMPGKVRLRYSRSRLRRGKIEDFALWHYRGRYRKVASWSVTASG
jgi:hypothetical protein